MNELNTNANTITISIDEYRQLLIEQTRTEILKSFVPGASIWGNDKKFICTILGVELTEEE